MLWEHLNDLSGGVIYIAVLLKLLSLCVDSGSP